MKSEREWGKMVFKEQNIAEKYKENEPFSNVMLEIEMNRKFSLLYPHSYIYMHVCLSSGKVLAKVESKKDSLNLRPNEISISHHIRLLK